MADRASANTGRLSARTLAESFVSGIAAPVRAALAGDPPGALRQHFQLTLQTVDTPRLRGNGGTCDGMSVLHDGIVLYRPSPGTRRENFTLLHELGHFLADEAEAVLDWAANQAEPERAIEEVCDRIAALLLLPPDKRAEVCADGSPTGQQVLDLFLQSEASREVCAIAVAERLPCAGFVALISRNRDVVTFAARNAGTRPYPWRDAELPPGHHLHRVAPQKPARARSWWPFADGIPAVFYLDAVADDDFVYAVFAVTDLWKAARFHGYDPVTTRPTRSGVRVECRSCGFKGLSYRYPCDTCHAVPCQKCEACECTRRAASELPCRVCHILTPRRRLVDRICDECRRAGRTG